MEYAGRRRRSRKKSGSGGGRAILALLLIGGIIYLVCVSAAGKWISQNVMVPIFEAFKPAAVSDETAEVSAAAVTESLPGETLSLASGKDSVSADITLPSMECFMLQMGVFSVRENADSAASSLKARGAGGYILEEADRYRVLASGYADETSASDVKDRLTGEGVDCTVFCAATPSATFRVSVNEEQLDSVTNGFAALKKAQSALCSAAIAYDAEGQTADQARTAVDGILTTLKSDMAVLSSYSGESEAVARLVSCYDSYVGALSALCSAKTQSSVDFSSELKYTQLYTTHEYMKLMESFA